MKCPDCKANNPANAIYCHMCGRKITNNEDFDKWCAYWKNEFNNNYDSWRDLVKQGVDNHDLSKVYLFSVTFKSAIKYDNAYNDLKKYGYGKPDWYIEASDDNKWNVLLTCPNVPLVIRVANMNGGRIIKWNTNYLAKPSTKMSISPIELKNKLIPLIKQGKISLAVILYQSKMGVDVNQAKQYIDDLCKEYNSPDSEPTTESSQGCYIATSVYGSYDCPEVWTLRRYRDVVLDKSWYGRSFIRLYYTISPVFVKWFGKTNMFKRVFKKQLDKWVLKLNKFGFENTPYYDKY